MKTKEKYQGSTNYETWAVKLWINNSESEQQYWLTMARSAKECAPNDSNVKNGIWTPAESARHRLAEVLKSWAEDSEAVEALAGTLWGDFLMAAIGNVDWSEVAEFLLAK